MKCTKCAAFCMTHTWNLAVFPSLELTFKQNAQLLSDDCGGDRGNGSELLLMATVGI